MLYRNCFIVALKKYTYINGPFTWSGYHLISVHSFTKLVKLLRSNGSLFDVFRMLMSMQKFEGRLERHDSTGDTWNQLSNTLKGLIVKITAHVGTGETPWRYIH